MARLTQEEYERRFYDIRGTKEFAVVGKYTKYHEGILIKHLKCGTEFEIIASHALDINRNIQCPKCSKNYPNVIPYVNDIYATNPEIYDLLTDKEDGHKYKAHSNKKISFTCPFCGNENINTISKVTEMGFSCKFCGEHCGSYAEKFILNLLNQLCIDATREFSPEWIKPYRYDIQFNQNNSCYILEIDGGWHYINNSMSNMSLDDVQERDKYKESIAQQHGYIIIRIDNNYGYHNKYHYLLNSINNSLLSDIFDLENVDFQKCHFNASYSSKILEVVKLWNSGLHRNEDIAKKCSINITTVRKYLQSACDSGLLDCSYDDIKSINKIEYLNNRKIERIYDEDIFKLWSNGMYNFSQIAKKLNISISTVCRAMQKVSANNIIPFSYDEILAINSRSVSLDKRLNRGQKVLCNETGEIFNSYKDAFEKYGVRLANYFNPKQNRKYCGKLPNGTRLTWTKIEDENVAQQQVKK